MNKPTRVHQDEIDLLAEGELNHEERKLLFARLDGDSTGWKRCAIALLEQRMLKDSFDSLSFGVSAPDKNSLANAEPKSLLAKPGLNQVNPWRSQVLTIAITAVAACILVVSGYWLGSFLNQKPGQPMVANSGIGGDRDSVPSAEPERVDWTMVRQANLAMKSNGVMDHEIVAFVGIGDASKRRVYPIIRSEELSRKMNEMPKPALPDGINQELQKTGWDLRTHQQFVSFDFPNGARQTMPVGMLNYSYVGRETF